MILIRCPRSLDSNSCVGGLEALNCAEAKVHGVEVEVAADIHDVVKALVHRETMISQDLLPKKLQCSVDPLSS